MAKSQETFSKKEREKKRKRKQEDKAQRKAERKGNSGGGLDSMIAYVDENGNFSSTPPDPNKRKAIKAEDIEINIPRMEAREEDPVRKGIVTFFDESKGYGFIRDLETQESIFSHVKSQIDQVKENDRVTFEVVQGPKGLNAVEVKLDR